MKYKNDFVDEKFSSILEPNLFTDTVLIPDVTYNTMYQGDANSGLVKIYKETKGASSDPKDPASDFTHEDTANTLIDVRLANGFLKSKKIYQVTANSVSFDKAESTLALTVATNREDRQYSALACLVQEGSVATSQGKKITDKVIDLRTALRKKHARPNIVFASVEVFAEMLKEAGDKYIPSTNENIITTGQVGYYLGMLWFEVDAFDKTEAKYIDHAGSTQTVDLTKVDLVVYDYQALHIVDNLNVMRIVDAHDFVGVYAQNEISSGFRVSNADKVAVLKKG